MEPKTFDTMNEAEFGALLDTMGTEEFGEVTTDQFFTALDSLRNAETEDVLELTATVREGQLVFEEPASLAAHANELYIGGKRIVIRLVGQTKQDTA